jgi:hypothetical protein
LSQRHLFVDISPHGFGHLGQTAPVLNALGERLPDLRLTVRSAVPLARLLERIKLPFEHIDAASDFGFAMIDALRIDHDASAERYRQLHRNWPERVATEAEFFKKLAPTAVLANIAYLPLAGARRAGIPAYALCSFSWVELFEHFFGSAAWAAPVLTQMRAAYADATCFLHAAPGMRLANDIRALEIGPLALPGQECRREVRQRLGVSDEVRLVLVALGGIQSRLAVEHWPTQANLRWLVPQAWECLRPDIVPLETLELPFADLLRSVDALVAKPGYGTFVEAGCCGVPVIYRKRDDWPEQDCLIDWLESHGRCREVAAEAFDRGEVLNAIDALIATPAPARPEPLGVTTAATFLAEALAAIA